MTGDPAAGVGIIAALGAGMISFLSPCVLPLVPGYLSAVSGVAPSDLDSTDWRRVLVPSLLFIASFSAIFIALGLTATGLGQALRDNLDMLGTVAGALIVAMGLLIITALAVPRLNFEWHPERLLERAGRGGPLALGAAFGLAWTPCIGPTLAAILSAASLSDSLGRGALLLAVYSAGLAIPFLATALAFSRLTIALEAVKRHYSVIMAVAGVILVAMGVLILTGEFFRLNIEAQKLMSDLGVNVSADF